MRVQKVGNEFKFLKSVESDADPYIVWNPNQEDLSNDCITLSRPSPTGFNRRDCGSHKAKYLCEFKSKCIYSIDDMPYMSIPHVSDPPNNNGPFSVHCITEHIHCTVSGPIF